jgi:hypothetical protein
LIWFFCLALVGVTGYFYISSHSTISQTILPLILGLGILGFATTESFTADRFKRTLEVNSRSLFRNTSFEIPFSDVASFEVEVSNPTRYSRRRGPTYRIVLIKTTGERLPLQQVFSSGYGSKTRIVRQLSEYLNLPVQDIPTNVFQSAIQSQAVITADPARARAGVTSGVSWSLEVHGVGGKEVTRWFSEGYTWPGQFLLVSQKPRGSRSFGGGVGGGFLGNLVQMLYAQVLGMYGFLPSDTPGIESATEMKNIDPRLAQDFTALSSDEVYAPQILNTWAAAPLLHWAERHPLGKISPGDAAGQIAVLYSPRGVHAAVLGKLTQAGEEELVDIGVELVKSQGSSGHS